MNSWIPKNKIVKFAAVTALCGVVLYFGGLFVISRQISKVENAYFSTESDLYKEEKSSTLKSIVETNKEPIQTLQNFFVKALLSSVNWIG